MKEKKEAYGLRSIGPEKFPKHKIPLSLMLKDLFTTRCGIRGKLTALYFAIVHPGGSCTAIGRGTTSLDR